MKYTFLLLVTALSQAAGCGDGVSSDEQARRAYLGLDAAIDKTIVLGFSGFNAASSANIPAQMTSGTSSGTMTITGQVDQGSSANKGMRLLGALVNYSDDGKLIYDTAVPAPLSLNMQLKGVGTSTGTLNGDLAGNLNMTGELSGLVTLSIVFSGSITGAQPQVIRQPGTTHITGTATSGGGTYKIDVTR